MKYLKKNLYLQCALLALITATCSFLGFIVLGKGTFLLIDDFSYQQIPFATAVQNLFRNGDIGEWNWNLDLGNSLITGYGFYNLGSPFYWISVLLPKNSYPYFTGWLYILKYVVASLTSFAYLSLFVKDKRYAIAGSLLYAFSGFQSTNLLFFHFHDVVALFPLLLIGIELVLRKNKTIVLLIAVFFNCTVNYFFFVGEVIFVILYFLYRSYSLKWEKFLPNSLSCLSFGALGVGLSAFLFIPNVIYILSNNRSQLFVQIDNLFYSSREILFLIKGFLLPGEAMNNESAVFEKGFSSTACYLPFLGISAVITYLKNKKNWLSKFLILLFAFAFIAVASSAFFLFTANYQRWWYMLSLMMVLTTIKVLENEKEYHLEKGALVNIIAVAFFFLLLAFFQRKYGNSIFNKTHFIILVGISILGPLLIILLIKLKKFNIKTVITFIIVFAIGTTSFTIYNYSKLDRNNYMADYNLAANFKQLNPRYRYKTGNVVYLMSSEAIGINSFSSTIENSSREFSELFDDYLFNDTGGRFKIYGLPELLGAKYSITTEKPVDYVDILEKNNTTYYIVESGACPIGFAVDAYIPTEEFNNTLVLEQRAIALMNAALIEQKDVSEISENIPQFNYDSIDYSADLSIFIDKTEKEKVSDFTRDNSGFTCTTDYNENKLVYFTVPYNNGWKATIDGTETKVFNSGGMMAIVAPAGKHTINFKFHTPGFRTGIVITLASFAICGTIYGVNAFKKRKNKI